MLTLERYRKRNSHFTEKIAETFSTRDRLRDLKGDADLLVPQSDLAILETEKSSKAVEELGQIAIALGEDGIGIRGEIRYIGDEIQGIHNTR